MPAIFIPRDLFAKFQGDAIDQHAQLVTEHINAAPQPEPPEPPTPPWTPPSGTPSATVADTAPGPPPLADLLASAGLGPAATKATTPAAPTAPAAPTDSLTPPPLQDLLRSAGLGDVGAAAGQTASNLGTAARGATDSLTPPPLQDLLRSAGLLSTPTPAVPSPSAAGAGDPVMDRASQFLGKPYVWGGKTAASGFDCSGLAGYLTTGQPESTTTLYAKSAPIDPKDAQPGDLVFYNMGQSDMHLQHVGTYIGDGKLVQAGGTADNVNVAAINQPVGSAPEIRRLNAGAAQPANGVPAQAHQSPAPADGSAVQTTAALSGGGDLAGKITTRGHQILSSAADTASWLGDQGQKALQAVLVTEGGLSGARGDNGQSAGPLQFYEGGQLANMARQLGLSLQDAKTWVEQNPGEAIKWAIGTPDKPGYLGAAIQAGIQKGLQGPDLATYAQQHGQVSVSPERAGANFSAMFGGGGGPVSTGASDTATTPAGTDWGAMTQKGIALGLQGQQLTDWINQQQPTTSPTAGAEAEATVASARNRAASDAIIQSTRDQQEAAAASPAPIYHSAMIDAGGNGPSVSTPAAPSSPLDAVKAKFSDALDAIGNLLGGIGGAAQTAPPEGGGYGAAPAGGVNPLDALGQVKDQALYGPTGQPPMQQQMDAAYQAGGVQLPASPLDVVGSAAGEPTEGERLTDERNQAIAEANPLRDTPFLGGATTMAAQTVLDPTNLVLMGEPGIARAGVAAGKAGVEALGSDAAQAALRSRLPAQVEVGAALGMGPGEAGPTINGMTGAIAQRVMEARDAPVPPQALQDAQQTLDGLAGAGGRAVGAPPQAQTAEGLAQLRQQLTAMAQAGASQKDWYADSSKAILEATQGNPQDAEKLAQLVAIYSPNTPVSANMNNALTAWYQWRAGRPISVAMKAQDERASNLLYSGAQWEGRKTNNFYRNLMQYIDPQVYAQMGQEAGQSGVTADIWMMRAFGYPATEGALTSSGQPREFLKAPSARQYDFIQNEVTHVAQQLGWTPEQVQAAVWTAAKAGSEGSTVEGAGYHYGHAIGERTGQVSWEASPGATAIQDIPGYASGTFAQKQAFHDATAQAFLDEQGHDIVAQKYGLLGGNTFGAAGVYRGEVSPGAQTKFALPQAKQSVGGVPIPANVGRIQEDSRDAINAYAATRGLLLKQDAVPWTRIFKTPTLKTSNAAVVDIGRALTPEEAASLDGSLAQALGPDGHAVVSTEQGAWLLNLGDTPNASFQTHARNAVKALESVDEARVAPARYDSEYIANDWTAQPNGEGYRDIIGRSGRAEQFGQLEDTLTQRIRSAQERAAAQNGWGPAATADTTTGNVGGAPAAATGGLLGRASDLLASPSTGGVTGGAQGAQISPAFALDVAGAVGGGAAGNASTPEDASPAERAGRIALGAAGGGLLAHHLATSGLRQRGEGINPLGAGLPLRPPGQTVDALTATLSRYPEDVKQVLRDFVSQQTEAGQTGKAINDTLRRWVAENPLPEAAAVKPGLPPTGRELLGPSGPQPGQLQMESQLPVGGPRPTGTESSGPAGRMPWQEPLATMEPGSAFEREQFQQAIANAPGPVKKVADQLGATTEPSRAFDLQALREMRQQYQASQPPLVGATTRVTPLDRFIGYTATNMLSGVGTAVQNTLGNFGQMLTRPVITAAAGYPMDAMRDVAAMSASLSEAFAAYGRTFVSGQRAAAHYQAPVGSLKNPLSYPMRNLGATDEFFRTLNSAGSAAAEASRRLRENPSLSFDQVLQRHTNDIVNAAADGAARGVYEKGGGLAGWLGEWVAGNRAELLRSNDPKEQAMGLVMQWLMPMTRVPGVILGEGIRSLPVVNEVRGIQRTAELARSGDVYAARQEAARTYLTTFANMGILSEVAQGNITGDGPTNPSDKQRLMEAVDDQGNAMWRPNSVRVGGKWIDYSGLGPLALPMSSIANGVDEALDRAQKPAGQQSAPPEFALNLVNREARTIGNAWYLKGLADVLSGIKEGTIGGTASSLTQVADRLVPGEALANEIRKVEDMYAREPSNVLQREANRIPFLSRTVPPRLSATTGKPQEQPEDWFSTLVRGTPSGMMTPNPVAAEVARLDEAGHRVSVPYDVKSFAGAKQTADQQRAIHEQVGTAVNMYVMDTLGKPNYAGLSDEQKANAVSQAVGQAQSAANISLGGQVARDPHESALMQWAQTPHYYGAKGTPEEIARKNWEIDQARAKLSDYRKQYGDAGEARMAKEDKAAFNLVMKYEPVSKEELDFKKAAIDRASGGALSQAAQKASAGGLVGVGSTTLPPRP